jgi:hypothetical protein
VPEAVNDPNSRLHRYITKTLRSNDAHLLKNETIKRWCEIWYLSRVNPGQINKATLDIVDGKYPDLIVGTRVMDEHYISKNIRLADKSTGYL